MYKRNKENRCEELYEALLQVETVEECKKFLEDLCTVNELRAMEQRYQVATYLHSGMIYSDILERTGASSATISRVNRSLQYGADGYALAFERMNIPDGKNKRTLTIPWRSGTTASPATCPMPNWRITMKADCSGRDRRA